MKVTLNNVRLSFPALFKPKVNKLEPDKDPKFGASLILDKKADASQIDALRNAVRAVALAQWPKGIPKTVKFCVRDGSEKETDGYGDGVIFLNATNQHRIGVVDRDMTPLVEEDGKPYAGCYVNAVIRLWAQDNNFGKRINAQLQGVQFSRDGEAFGDKPFNPQENFRPLDASDDDASAAEYEQARATGTAGRDPAYEDTDDGSDIPF